MSVVVEFAIRNGFYPKSIDVHPRLKSDARQGKPSKMTLKSIASFPLHLVQVFSTAKSFEENQVLGNRVLNRLGLHVFRVLLAHGITGLRSMFFTGLASPADRQAMRRQGYLVKDNFLPPEEFLALEKEVRQFKGDTRECTQGDTLTHRTLLDPDTLKRLPHCAQLINSKAYRHLLQWAATRYTLPMIHIEQILNGHGPSYAGDPQKHLHADTFHPTMKAWLFLEDVEPHKGPFNYVPGSHKLTLRRLAWEYRQSVRGKSLPDTYARRGSLRCTEDDRLAMSLPQPTPLTVRKNTLVIANTFGFHARGTVTTPCTRLEIYADSRTNPFNPLPGLDNPWLTRLWYRGFKLLRAYQDKQAARQGRVAAWHRVDADKGSNPSEDF